MTTTPEKMAQAARNVRVLRLLLGDDSFQKMLNDWLDPTPEPPDDGDCRDDVAALMPASPAKRHRRAA